MLARRKTWLHHQMNMRIDDSLLSWIISKSDAAKMPPSTYARKVIEAEAQRDLVAQDGPEAA